MVKNLKIGISLGLLAILSTLISQARAELIEVYTWKALPGKGAQMLETFVAAKAIHEEMGATVSINQQMTGSAQEVDYVMRWDDSEAWGKSLDNNRNPAMAAKWQAFLAKANLDPAGEMIRSSGGANVDSSKKAADFKDSYVYGVYVWEPEAGQTLAFMQTAMEAEKLHEEMGARVEIYTENVGTPGRVHYVMMWDSYSDWAGTTAKMSNSKAWAALAARTNNGLGTLTSSFRAQTLVP